MKRVGLGVVVALACAAGCDGFTADPPASTSDAGADAAADAPPPVVGGNPVPDDCDRPTVAYDFESGSLPKELVWEPAPSTGSEGAPHRTFAHFSSGSPTTLRLTSSEAAEVCLRFAFRVNTLFTPEPRPAAQTWPFVFINVRVKAGAAVTGSVSQSNTSFTSTKWSENTSTIGPTLLPDAGRTGTWHVASFVAKLSAGRLDITTGLDGSIVGTTRYEAFDIPNTLPLSATFGTSGPSNDSASVDIDDIRVRTTN